MRNRAAASRFRSIVDWFRCGYPDDAPDSGHSPLLALFGPPTLSNRQLDEIVDGLPANRRPVDIKVAITKATNRMPTEAQVCEVTRALERRARGV
jgi:Protein of unknown function (DUF3349)